jgi:hypothetical protein
MLDDRLRSVSIALSKGVILALLLAQVFFAVLIELKLPAGRGYQAGVTSLPGSFSMIERSVYRTGA